ncbi:MAG: DUF2341 domain-containing protein [Candidatus Pacebacteria bacterium]|nr:DUF2341 domain-containing protein [Candidatus Paceibacterota bacterium]MDD5752739.1 DUF2341 domain-containing protein [Candidatus Paceibacterota bacterium]
MKNQKHLQLIILSLFLVFGFAIQSVFAAPVCGNATTCNWKSEADIVSSNGGSTPYPGFKMCSVGISHNLHMIRDGLTILGFGWDCIDNTTVQCTAGYASTSYCPTIINGVCGSSNGGTFSTAPSTNLCSTGTASSVTTGSTTYTWTCAGSGGGTTASCSANRAVVNGVCGSVNNTNVTSLTSSSPNLCSSGTVSNWNAPPVYSSYWWICDGSGGGTNSDWCVAHIIVNGACGSQSSPTSGGVTSGSLTSSSPNLCSLGTVANFQIFNGGDGDAYWWNCSGAYGGTNSDWCLIHIKQNGVLGTANGHTYASTDTSWGSYTQCSVGNPSNTTFPSQGGSTSWYCSGLWTGTNSGTGIAYRSAPVINGSCGSAKGHGYPSTSYIDTSAERCAVGTFTSFTDNGSSWSWSCSGSGGGTTASCSAPKVSCGSYHNTTRRDQPSTNLCTYGSNTTLSLASNKWSWSCTNNPGINASCYTYKTSCGSSNGGTYTSVPTSLCTYGTASSVTSGTSTYTWTCTGNDSLPVSCSATRNYVVTYTSSTGGSCTPSSRTVAYNGTSAAPACTPSSGYILVGFTRTSGSGGTLNTSTGAVTGVTGSQTIRADFGLNGSCGTADGHTYASTDSSWTPYTQCATGTPSSTTFPEPGASATWTCLGQNGGTDSGTCSASRTVGISCGSYHNTTRKDQPSTNLCVSSANTSLVLNNNTWYWNCESEPETPAACYTYKTSCGSSNGGTFVSAPETNLCTYGDPSSVTTGSTTYTWTCTGDDSLTVSCSATIDNSVDGLCGSSNGGSFTTAPLTNLCDAGNPSEVIDNTTTFDWTCTGINGGSTASCSAIQLDQAACGSADGGSFATTPSSNLCSEGIATEVLGTGPWTWSCETEGTTWLEGYDYRKEVEFTNSGSVLTNYQMQITVSYDSDMQVDFDDIRFTDSTGITELNYWRESKVDSSTATFWVKVPSIASGSSSIYMYYGNDSVSTTSNEANVFDFVDYFDDGSVSDWTVSYAYKDGSDAGSMSATTAQKVSGSYSLYLYSKSHCNHSPWDGIYTYANKSLNFEAGTYIATFYVKATGGQYTYCRTGTIPDASALIDGTVIKSLSNISYSGCSTSNTVNWTSLTSNSFTLTEGTHTFKVRSRATDCEEVRTYWDNVKIRKYTDSVPSVVFKDEESEVAGTVAYCSANLLDAPSATSLSNPLDIDSNASCWYCDKYLEETSVISGKSGNLEFKFTYTDSDSEAKIIGYDFAISQGSDPLNPVFSDSIDLSINPLSPNTIITYNNASVKRSGENELLFLKQIAYNKIYNWWVKVYNDKGASSDWVQASSTFTTPSRAFPLVRVVPQKSSLVLDESTLMCSTTDSVYRGEDQSGCFDACWTGEGDTAILDPNNLDNGWNCSICYNTSQSPVLCSSGNNNTFTWSLVNGSADLTNTTNNNVTITATNTGEEIRTRLLITGSDGCAGEQGEGEGSYPSLPLPTWKEVGN